MKQRLNKWMIDFILAVSRLAGMLVLFLCFAAFVGIVRFYGDRPTIVVGYPIVQGFQDIDENGNYFGYNHEIIQNLARRNHWRIAYVVDSFDHLYKMILANEIDLLGGINDTEETRSEVHFAQYANGSDNSVVLTSHIDASLNQYKALHQTKIGFLTNTRAIDEMIQLGQRYKIQFETVLFDDYDELMQAMEKKQVDAISFSSRYTFDQSLVIAEHYLKDYYFVTNKSNTKLLRQLNDGLAAIADKQPTLYQELDRHFYQEKKTTAFVSSFQQQWRMFFIMVGGILGICLASYVLFLIFFDKKEIRETRRIWLNALIHDELKVNFTPIARYSDGEIRMYSIQYYWDSMRYGTLSKEEILNINGNTMRAISRFHEFRVVLRSVRQLMEIESLTHVQYVIQIHSSYASWWTLTHFMLTMHMLLWLYRVPPQRLLFSFSSNIVHDEKTKYSINKACKSMGINFMMNDFGLQFSSLSQIKTISYDYFKIDRLYTADFTHNDLSLQIIKLIINIALSLDKEVIIEGIDTQEMYALTSHFGCHYMQGELVGGPMTLDKLLGESRGDVYGR